MNTLAILLRRGRKLLTSNAPAILTAIGASGVVGTAVLAVKATKDALMEIGTQTDENGFLIGFGYFDDDWKKIVKKTWKFYIPTALTGAASIAAIIGSNSINARRIAAGLSAVSILETGISEYREKVIEKLGEKNEKALRDEIMEKKISDPAFSGKEVIITDNGDVLCYDTLSDRTFMSTIEKIRGAVNDINEICLQDMSASQNEFYRLIGLPPTRLGDDLGWRFDRLLKIDIGVHMTRDSRPCLAIEYIKPPIQEFYKING